MDPVLPTPPPLRPPARPLGTTVALWIVAGGLVIVIYMLLRTLVHGREVEILVRLGTGWIWHLQETLPKMSGSGGKTLGGAVAVVFTWGVLHAFAGQSASGPWSYRWTTAWAGLVLALAVAAGSLVMLAHHLSWLPRETVFYWDDRSDATLNISNARQMVTALRIYASDHDGRYPDRLEDLVAVEVVDRAFLEKEGSMILPGGMKMPWRVLAGVEDRDPGNLPVVVSPASWDGRRHLIGFNDSMITFVSTKEYEEAMGRWRDHLRKQGRAPGDIPRY